MALTSPERLLLGTDIPYMTFETALGELSQMGVDAKGIAAIEGGNALRILPSLAAHV
jgi:predicted TIM-barrel fold metal-dependent hydrolase